MMMTDEEKAARETLRRLRAVLDEPDEPDDIEGLLGPANDIDLPTDEEARALVTEMGIDLPALAARLQALAVAFQAGQALQGESERVLPANAG